MNDPYATNVSSQREIGFARALAAADISPEGRITQLSYVRQDRASEMGGLLDAGKLSRSVFCWSDIDGIQLINEARRRGLRVPEDVSVIGYDNSSIGALHSVDLASIDQSGARIRCARRRDAAITHSRARFGKASADRADSGCARKPGLGPVKS